MRSNWESALLECGQKEIIQFDEVMYTLPQKKRNFPEVALFGGRCVGVQNLGSLNLVHGHQKKIWRFRLRFFWGRGRAYSETKLRKKGTKTVSLETIATTGTLFSRGHSFFPKGQIVLQRYCFGTLFFSDMRVWCPSNRKLHSR